MKFSALRPDVSEALAKWSTQRLAQSPSNQAALHSSRETPAEFFARLCPHEPHPKQLEFLNDTSRELFWGGGGGGGKSDGALMLCLKYAWIPGFSATILRRTNQQMTKADAILARAMEWWIGKPGVKYSAEKHTFYFQCPGGGVSSVAFGHLEDSFSHHNYQGMRSHLVVFEELTQHLETHYRYLFSRQRKNAQSTEEKAGRDSVELMKRSMRRLANGTASTADIPMLMRSTGNPDGPHRDWVYERFVNPETRDHGADWMPSRVEDNPSIDLESYDEGLQKLDPLTYKRLRYGEGWESAEPGDFFDRANFVIAKEPPPRIQRRVRFYDFASSKKKNSKFTASTLMALVIEGGVETFWVLDSTEVKWGAAEQPQMLALQAAEDGRDVIIRWELEGGSSGSVATEAAYKPALDGYDADGVRPNASKEDRAKPLAAKVMHRKVYVLERHWTKKFLDRHHGFPNDTFKDVVDATTGAFNWLTEHKGSIPTFATGSSSVTRGLLSGMSKRKDRWG